MNQTFLTRSGRLLGLLLLTIWSAGLFAQTIVYEREFSLVGDSDNTLRITLTPDDRVTIERPAIMTRPGRLESDVPTGTHARLSDALNGIAPIARSVDQDIQRRAANELVYVTDPEYTRFLVLDAQRQVVESVEATSIEAWSRHFADDIRLSRLVELERDWLSVMDQVLSGGVQ